MIMLVTLETAISKSSCVTWTRLSRSANIPASVHTPCIRCGEEQGGGTQSHWSDPQATQPTQSKKHVHRTAEKVEKHTLSRCSRHT